MFRYVITMVTLMFIKKKKKKKKKKEVALFMASF